MIDAALLLGDDVVGVDLEHVVFRLDVDALAVEKTAGVRLQVRVEHAEDLGRDVVDGDARVLGDRRERLGEVLGDQVVQLGRKLDAGRPAADDGKVQQVLDLRLRDRNSVV